MTERQNDGPTTDDELAPPRNYGPDIWDGTGFGPALGGLLVAFLAVWGGGVFLTAFSMNESAGYRVVSGIAPVLMGATGVALGWMTLRRRDDGLSRAIAAAAIVVGVLAIVTGALNWWGQEIIHDSQSLSERLGA